MRGFQVCLHEVSCRELSFRGQSRKEFQISSVHKECICYQSSVAVARLASKSSLPQPVWLTPELRSAREQKHLPLAGLRHAPPSMEALTFSRCGIIAGLIAPGGCWAPSPRDSRSFCLILTIVTNNKEEGGRWRGEELRYLSKDTVSCS